MKRFRFELQQLLNLKYKAQQVASWKLAEARSLLDSYLHQLSQLQQQLDDIARHQHLQVGDCTTAAGFLVRQEHVTSVQRQIEFIRQSIQAAEQAWQDAVDQHRQLDSEVRTLTRLRDAHHSAYQQMAARAQQNQLDETVLRRWALANKELGLQPNSSDLPAGPGSLPSIARSHPYDRPGNNCSIF